MQLTEHAVSAGPLLKAIAAGGDLSNTALAEASGRSAKNMPRDLDRLVEAGWIAREPGSPPAITDAGRDVLATLARADGTDGGAVELPLHLIDENPENPRTAPCDEDDADLTATIGRDGVLQPIMVRPSPEPGRFVVIMGGRRRRCSIAAGKFTIPAVIRDVDRAKAFEIATIENLQRADMNPLDEARAFKRILDDHLAADPSLKLKDAKEIIAQASSKSVRFVELRLQLLDLPPVLQVEIREGKLAPKDAILRQRQMPKLNAKTTPRQWLTLVEVFDKCQREPRPVDHDWQIPDTLCRSDARVLIDADPEVSALRSSYDLTGPHHIWADEEKTGQFCVSIHGSTMTQLRLLFADRLGVHDADPNDAKLRAKLLAALRVEALGDGAPKLKAGQYVTPWLNGPFDPTPEVLAEIAAERERRDARSAQHLAEQEARQAEARAAQDRHERDNGEPGRAFLAAVRAFEDVAPGMEFADFTAAFRAVSTLTDAGGPWALQPTDDADDPTQICDATGKANRASGPALEARRRLIVIALNYAAGFAAFSGEAFPTPWDGSEPEGGAQPDEQPIGDVEDDEPFEDAPEDDEEVEDEDAQADDETPGFLSRLAGVREPEARP